MLAQVVGMEHNHHHVYVQKVILWTDHKTLVSHFAEASGISFQKTTVPTAAASTLWLQDIYYKPGKDPLPNQ